MHGVLLDERPFQDPAHSEMMQVPAAQLIRSSLLPRTAKDRACSDSNHLYTRFNYKASTIFSQRKKHRLHQFSQSDS